MVEKDLFPYGLNQPYFSHILCGQRFTYNGQGSKCR